MKKLLLGGYLAKPPSPPGSLKVRATSNSFEVSWRPAPLTSPYNTDAYEVEMAPKSIQLRAALGEDFSRFVQFYAGAEPACTIGDLRPEQPFAVRVRCVNRKGASAWVETEAVTCQVPINCGGTGPMEGTVGGTYAWDQTPTHVEICVPAPPSLLPKEVKVRVKPKHIEVTMGDEAVLVGKLFREVLCQEPGDFEWELRNAGGGEGGRELFITLEKRVLSGECVRYDPQEQWDRVLDEAGHPKIDRSQLKWFRDYEWRPPQDARTVDEVKQALPGMDFSDTDQTNVGGRDGELDDWGRDWGKGKK